MSRSPSTDTEGDGKELWTSFKDSNHGPKGRVCGLLPGKVGRLVVEMIFSLICACFLFCVVYLLVRSLQLVLCCVCNIRCSTLFSMYCYYVEQYVIFFLYFLRGCNRPRFVCFIDAIARRLPLWRRKEERLRTHPRGYL